MRAHATPVSLYTGGSRVWHGFIDSTSPKNAISLLPVTGAKPNRPSLAGGTKSTAPAGQPTGGPPHAQAQTLAPPLPGDGGRLDPCHGARAPRVCRRQARHGLLGSLGAGGEQRDHRTGQRMGGEGEG